MKILGRFFGDEPTGIFEAQRAENWGRSKERKGLRRGSLQSPSAQQQANMKSRGPLH